MRFILLISFTLLASLYGVLSENMLQEVTKEDLLPQLNYETPIVVLYTKENCDQCDEMERALTSMQDELSQALGAVIVKVIDNDITSIYSPGGGPALLYYRHGVPLLYNGEIDDELIYYTLTENKEPCVKVLHDKNFEHLTQVTSGATTGDWFVMFHDTKCNTCSPVVALWEAVGAALRTKMNVASIYQSEGSLLTRQRFNVCSSLAFILFHQGYMYTYKGDPRSINELIDFAMNFWEVPGEIIPNPPSALDILMEDLSLPYMRCKFFFRTGVFGICVIFLGTAYVLRYPGLKHKRQRRRRRQRMGQRQRQRQRRQLLNQRQEREHIRRANNG